ncbi:hypothetical protein TNCV_3165221 [Trichonephila clavipes]|nr:hypothetical protein TNCV_3165221 [Trichonephila clavipes]
MLVEVDISVITEVLLLLIPPDRWFPQIEAHEIPRGNGIVVHLVAFRTIPVTVRFGSVPPHPPVLRENSLEGGQGAPSLSSPSVNIC